MKEYEAIAIGTGSAMMVIDAMASRNPGKRYALIDKDEPGGICLTRGCIPSKLLIYPADLVRTIEEARELGIDAEIKRVDFAKVMARMHSIIDGDIAGIRKALAGAPNTDYYNAAAEFAAPYTLRVGGETIQSKTIILGTGSRAAIPNVPGLSEAGYITSDSILHLKKLPESVAIIGGGYIAAEYGHFLSAMGSKVTIIGRNPQFIPEEEPEVSRVAKSEMSRRMAIVTNQEVVRVEKAMIGGKAIIARDWVTGKEMKFYASEILVASGRISNSDILHPERAGVALDAKGWIVVNERLETSQPGIYALGDATGKWLFRHKANHDAKVLFENLVLGKNATVDYRAVPHAVFCHPEIASFGMREAEAVKALGQNNISIGFESYGNTGKGMAMNVKLGFCKVIVENKTGRLLGAHIVGPHASVLLQELVNATYGGGIAQVNAAMYIHPALSEVVSRACRNIVPVEHYHHVLGHLFGNEGHGH